MRRTIAAPEPSFSRLLKNPAGQAILLSNGPWQEWVEAKMGLAV